jgi:hypothetical protein
MVLILMYVTGIYFLYYICDLFKNIHFYCLLGRTSWREKFVLILLVEV